MHSFTYDIILDRTGFDKAKSYLETTALQDPLVLDTETDNKEEILANMYGFGVCVTDDYAMYFPFLYWDGKQAVSIYDDQLASDIISFFNEQSVKRGLVGHNFIYDVLVYENNTGFVMDEFVKSDTILLKHILQEEKPFGLKEVAVQELGAWADKAQQKLKDEVLAMGGKWTKDQKDMYMATKETLGEYCCWDVILTKLLYDKFEAQLKQNPELHNLFYNEEVMPLYRECTINMKRHGFPVNMEHFESLQAEINQDLEQLDQEMYDMVRESVHSFEVSLLEKEFPMSKSGNSLFPKVLAKICNVPLPVKKDGSVTLAKKPLEKQRAATPEYSWFYDWYEDKAAPLKVPNEYMELLNYNSKAEKVLYGSGNDIIEHVRRELWKNKHNSDRVFNFGSGDHLIELFFNIRGFKPTKFTDKGKPSVDAEFVEELAKKDPFAYKLNVFKKLVKIRGTYIDGIINRAVDGVIYTSMLQFGTTSGRFSSKDPNLQNLPRPKDEDKIAKLDPLIVKYNDAIRAGFVAPEGYKIVDADYSSLEPRCFAHMSDDDGLREIYFKGLDLYSKIAIDVFGLKGVSSHPDDDDFLKKLQPSFRQQAKIFCLAVPYGAEASRISHEMGVSYQEANKIIQKYLNAYPNLKRYMRDSNVQAKKNGEVRTDFGRVRHLKDTKAIYTLYGDNALDYKWAKKNKKEDIRRKIKNGLNNAKNFRIQGLAAHIVNRAMIAISRKFREHKIDGYVALQVHDQICSIVREEQLDLACSIVQDCMENVTKISVPLIAQPEVATNLRDSH